MRDKSKLIKNTAIIAIGKCSTQVVSFILLPMYTKILSESEYGTFDFISTVALFLIPFITLLMEEAMFRFLIDADTDDKKRLIITQSIIYIMITIALFSAVSFISLNLVGYYLTNYLIMYVIASILNSLAETLLRGLSRIKEYSIFGFLTSFLNLVLNIVLVLGLRAGVKGLLIAYIVSNLISAIIIFIRTNLKQYISFEHLNIDIMKSMIKYSYPLVPNSISWVIINLSDRLVITTFLGTAANGIYAVSNKFPNLINTIYGFFYTAWKEEAARAIKDTNCNEYYCSIYKQLKRFLFAISVGLIAVLPFMFDIFINEKFKDAYIYIPILVLSIFFSNISGFYGGIFSAKKDTKIMGTTTIVSAIVNIVVNLALVKFIGIYAAVLSTFISSFLICVYRKYKLKKYVEFESDNIYTIVSIVIFFIIFWCYYSKSNIFYILGFILAVVYSCITNLDMLKMIISKVRGK